MTNELTIAGVEITTDEEGALNTVGTQSPLKGFGKDEGQRPDMASGKDKEGQSGNFRFGLTTVRGGGK